MLIINIALFLGSNHKKVEVGLAESQVTKLVENFKQDLNNFEHQTLVILLNFNASEYCSFYLPDFIESEQSQLEKQSYNFQLLVLPVVVLQTTQDDCFELRQLLLR